MEKRQAVGQTGRRRALFAGGLAALLLLGLLGGFWARQAWQPVMRITNLETGEVCAEWPVQPGDSFYFGWIHSLDKFPWHEHYHVDENWNLVVDTISFPCFGAGVPHAKGATTYVADDGLIYMTDIDQKFEEIVWINSHTATQEIILAGKYKTRGSELPQHTRLRLTIERRGFHVG